VEQQNLQSSSPNATGTATTGVPALGLAVALVLTGAGAYVAVTRNEWALLAGGGVALAIVATVWQVAAGMVGSSKAMAARGAGYSAQLGERVEQICVMLNTISDQQLLSDRAKSVAYRDKDSEALRRAIREEIAKQNYESAAILVDEMERTFGYAVEAESFRNELQQRKDERLRKQVGEAMNGVDRLVREERWPDAFREADRLRERFPNLDSVKLLPKEIELRRNARKKQLMADWTDAINRHDNDASIEALKRLDPYLLPAEAEQMQETVRGVFKEKLAGLRTKFSLAVQDHRWAEAVRLGEQISAEFPNSRIATEVNQSMDALRKRAAEEPETAEPASV
jgi:hypothetical protein